MIKNYDSDKEFTESDWKLFRKQIGGWQENYINRLNKEYITILSQDKNPAENFWQLEKRMREDKKKTGVIIDLRRSTMILNIIELLNDKVICMDDLNDFSDTFKDTIQSFNKYFK